MIFILPSDMFTISILLIASAAGVAALVSFIEVEKWRSRDR